MLLVRSALIAILSVSASPIVMLPLSVMLPVTSTLPLKVPFLALISLAYKSRHFSEALPRSLFCVTLGTMLLSTLPTTVIVSALLSPKSTLPFAVNNPPMVTLLVTVKSLAVVLPMVIAPNVAAPVTVSVPPICALVSTCRLLLRL